jgi:hypothetical protein
MTTLPTTRDRSAQRTQARYATLTPCPYCRDSDGDHSTCRVQLLQASRELRSLSVELRRQSQDLRALVHTMLNRS